MGFVFHLQKNFFSVHNHVLTFCFLQKDFRVFDESIDLFKGTNNLTYSQLFCLPKNQFVIFAQK